MTDYNSFNVDDISPQEKTNKILPGHIGLIEKRTPAQLETAAINAEIQVQQTTSIFAIENLDENTQKELAELAQYHYEVHRISEPTIQSLMQYHFTKIMNMMRSEYQSYLFDKQLEEAIMKQMGFDPQKFEQYRSLL